MIGTIKQTARASRKEASVQDRGSMGILIGLQWVGIALNFLLAGLFQAAAIPWRRTALFGIGVTLILLGVALRWCAIWTLGRSSSPSASRILNICIAQSASFHCCSSSAKVVNAGR
jgi:hypothetical protein